MHDIAIATVDQAGALASVDQFCSGINPKTQEGYWETFLGRKEERGVLVGLDSEIVVSYLAWEMGADGIKILALKVLPEYKDEGYEKDLYAKVQALAHSYKKPLSKLDESIAMLVQLNLSPEDPVDPRGVGQDKGNPNQGDQQEHL